MKIALFLPNLCGGGSERVMVKLSNALAKRGMKVDLVLGEAKGQFLCSVDRGVNIINFGKQRIIGTFWPLVCYLRREKPLVLISSLGHANIVAIVARCFSLIPVRIIVLVQNVYSRASNDYGGLRVRFLSVAIKWLYPLADAIVADSQGSAEDIIKCGGIPRNLVRCIYNPVIDTNMMALAKKTISHTFFEAGSPPVILGAGTLIPLKDFPTLIKAFYLVQKKHPCSLIILGEGPDRGRLERIIEELNIKGKVSLPGFSDNPYAYMARSAVFVVSSERESMSLVLVEALALGVTAVASNCDYGPREILQNGKYGRLVPVGDISAMADAIQCALIEPRRQIPEEILQPFTVDGAVDKYVSLISELMRN